MMVEGERAEEESVEAEGVAEEVAVEKGMHTNAARHTCA